MRTMMMMTMMTMMTIMMIMMMTKTVVMGCLRGEWNTNLVA